MKEGHSERCSSHGPGCVTRRRRLLRATKGNAEPPVPQPTHPLPAGPPGRGHLLLLSGDVQLAELQGLGLVLSQDLAGVRAAETWCS